MLFEKEFADVLFQQEKMPEKFYRQHYKTAQQNYIDYQQKNRQFFADKREIENKTDEVIDLFLNKLFKEFK